MTRFAAFALVVAVSALAGCNRKPDDQALVQGEWVIASVETPDEDGRKAPAELKDILIVVKGNRITATHAKEKGGVAALFALDPTKNPKEVDAPEVFVTEGHEERAMPMPGRGIYKFEGDELVIALAVSMGKDKDLPRPTEFKAKAGGRSGVIVVHLKKKQ